MGESSQVVSATFKPYLSSFLFFYFPFVSAPLAFKLFLPWGMGGWVQKFWFEMENPPLPLPFLELVKFHVE